MRTFLIFIFVALVSLFVYNPEMDDFNSFQAKSDKQTVNNREQTAFTDRMFNADTTTAPPPKPAGYTTERNNYVLFSIYRVTKVDDFREIEEGRYLGIATMFFSLGTSENMTTQVAHP